MMSEDDEAKLPNSRMSRQYGAHGAARALEAKLTVVLAFPQFCITPSRSS